VGGGGEGGWGEEGESSRPMQILIAGCGYVGEALARRLVAHGHDVWGLKRHPAGLPAGTHPVAADVTDAEGLARALGELPDTLDAVVYAVAAGERSESAYRRAYVDGPANLVDALCPDGKTHGARLLFVSSTGVYGDRGGDRGGDPSGGWVDETTDPRPDNFTGRTLLEGEEHLLDRADLFTRGVAVLRFGGIYGPGRTRLIDQVRAGEARCTEGPPIWTNRIHRDDCAGFLAHLLTLPTEALPVPAIYLGVDSEPAELCDVLRWLARQVGAPEPTTVPQVQGARRRSSKRCRNDRLVASGYRLLYPTYREGYGSLLAPSS